MTDKEKRDDAEIQYHLKKVYGFSEEQLLKELETTEKSVSDSDFPGAEDRIFQKLMARKAEEEKKEKEIPKKTEPEEAIPDVTKSEKTEPEEAMPERTEPKKKVVRFRKKSIILAAAVAAILALTLGMTAIGEKNYFMRIVGDDINYRKAIDNDQNKLEGSQLEAAYSKIEEELNIPVLKLLYIPEGMEFSQLELDEEKALVVFEKDNNTLYYFLKRKDIETSYDIDSDEQKEYNIYNKWLKKDIKIRKNILDNGEEYEAQVQIDNIVYCFTGIISEEELEKIVKNLHF